jgi:hypothetical protein
VSADTDVPASQGVQGLNRYSYVNNNPLRYTDPTGHAAIGDTNEAGCSGGGPACIISMYSPYGDEDGMMDSLRHYVRRHKDYNPQVDSELSLEDQATVAIAMFQVAADDAAHTPNMSFSEILQKVLPSAELTAFYSLIVGGPPDFNMMQDEGGGGGSSSSGPTWTKKMLSESEVIAQGYNIREVDELVRIYGGNPKGWKKMKGWDEYGQEWHWYYHPDVGRVKVKSK